MIGWLVGWLVCWLVSYFNVEGTVPNLVANAIYFFIISHFCWNIHFFLNSRGFHSVWLIRPDEKQAATRSYSTRVY